jgi:RimJ/RimL family protein N-acetyltransferase
MDAEDATPIPLPDPPLGDDEIVLVPWGMAGVAPEVVAEACNDPAVAAGIPVPHPYTVEDARDFISLSMRNWEQGTDAGFAILSRADGHLLGALGYHPLREYRASIGYWLAPWARGRGVATRAARLVARWAFETYPIERLELFTLDDNEASQRVAERAGFTREGLLRRWTTHRGEVRDCVMFSLLRDELR